MASNISLQQMQEYGVHDLCLRLCRDVMGFTPNDNKTLKYLLPVKMIVHAYPRYGTVQFKNPKTEESFEYAYSDDESRVEAVTRLNEHIKKYNDDLYAYEIELDKRIGLEKRVIRVAKEKLFPHNEFEPYLLHVHTEMPVYNEHWKSNSGRWQRDAVIGIRDFNSEKIYEKIHACGSEREAVFRFNVMIYEYLKAKTEGMNLNERSTLYYPILEFEDYFSRMDNSFPNLLEQDTEDLNTRSPFADVLYHNTEGKYWYSPDEENPPVFSLKDYKIVIDAEKQTLEVSNISSEYRIEKKSVTLSWKEVGLHGTKVGMNRHLQLMTRYAFFQEVIRSERFQSETKAMKMNDAFKKAVSRYYPPKTLQSYHSHLKSILKDLLHLHDYKEEETIERHSRKVNDAEFLWYTFNIYLSYKRVVDTNKVDTLKSADVSDINVWNSKTDVYSMNDSQKLEKQEYPLDDTGNVRDDYYDSSDDDLDSDSYID